MRFSKKHLLIGAAAVLVFFCFAVVIIVGDWISGGKVTERKGAAVLQTNEFIVRAFQGLQVTVQPSQGPSRVHLGGNGLRSGFYSFSVKAETTNAEFKVQWSETAERAIEILSISRS